MEKEKHEDKYAVASVKAFVERGGKILILRESPKYKGGSHHGRFVMPGGKVNEGEHFLDALRREVKEECGLAVKIYEPFHVDEWRINVPGKPKHIVGTYFRPASLKGAVNLNSDFASYEWIDPKDYKQYDINDAARRAFVTYLKNFKWTK